MEDTLQFKISSALKDLVGKDLITTLIPQHYYKIFFLST